MSLACAGITSLPRRPHYQPTTKSSKAFVPYPWAHSHICASTPEGVMHLHKHDPWLARTHHTSQAFYINTQYPDTCQTNLGTQVVHIQSTKNSINWRNQPCTFATKQRRTILLPNWLPQARKIDDQSKAVWFHGWISIKGLIDKSITWRIPLTTREPYN